MPRYNPQGRTKVYWVPTIAAAATPTIAEITAGVRLDEHIVPDSIAGFTSEGQTVDATDLAAKREKNVPGLATTTNGSFALYRGDEAADTEATLLDDFLTDLATNEAGYVVFVPNGSVADGELADVFPSAVLSVNAAPPQGGQSARWTVGFSHPAEPTLNAVIDAGV